ncbi:glycosyltransferase [Elizabethkingia anophelis]|uniref:glycosyltransferase n=1 Tax=Elizabethkingia anophelis TaxID=1117645 RepID=UPI00099A8A68|nr:glycosyltransferase [Elizabethkingia anophelis]MCT4223073.1 glycosyltransferase [Elizabethkingia anophelis]MCT4330842.1 glycosyltransferase [Elizabethkingia anophelis]MDV3865661.1 hypothetical protein [Elizabethkingia anophelis]MYY26424.1 glycosyltransferase [Elizabethkingia anophelis]OPC46280.1 hypothetical protein BAY05_09975 [Elizabethkingia anophelis]
MMKINKKIAILLGAYNAEKYIAEQIDSIVNQSYNNWELYVRDDNSKDNTLNIIRSYVEKYDNIYLIEDESGNLGCNGNYFRLLKDIEATYYMFCNADDFWTEDKIEISIKKMLEVEAETNSDNIPIIIHTDLAVTDSSLNIIHQSLWQYDRLDPTEMYTYDNIGICNIVAGATMLFNNKVKQLTFPVSQYAPFFDHWMALKVLEAKGRVVPVYSSTVLYRQIGSNLAAINLGKQNTILYKFKNLKKILNTNYKEAQMLKNIGWGGYIKYVYIKLKILLKLRVLNK